MLLRIWRTEFDRDRLDELEAFANDISAPMFRDLPGCVGYTYAHDESTWLTITRWDNAESIEAAERSPRYREVVHAILDRGFLGVTQTTESYELTASVDFD